MQHTRPVVSVIIPTLNRPRLVLRAARSALAQTLQETETVVVQDGPNDATVQALSQIEDSRLRVHVLPQRVGTTGAYNAGIAEARGHWVALLDDDDEFLPPKLELQLKTARQSPHRFPIVLCRLIGSAPSGDRIWPRRAPAAAEPLSEWLFCRRSPFFGEGLAQSDMFFAHKELFRAVPLGSDLRDCDDMDWILRASAVPGAEVHFVPSSEPLAIWYLDEHRSRMSLDSDWRYALSWLRDSRHLVTPRAYAAFLLTWVGADQARRGQLDALVPLLREALCHGRPAAIDLLTYLGHWMLPEGLKRRAAALFSRRYRLSDSDAF